MSVENRIFWLIVALLGLYLVLSDKGRAKVGEYWNGVTGGGKAGNSPNPLPQTPAGGDPIPGGPVVS